MLKYRKTIIAIGLMLLMIQLYRPNKNIPNPSKRNDFLVFEDAPKDVKKLFKNSCYDCHSNNTSYKWFDNISPISWYVDNTIEAAQNSLNFSNWRTEDDLSKEIMFQAIIYNIRSRHMPPINYSKFHPESHLTEIEKTKMIKWIQKVKIHFLKGKE